MNCNGYVSSVTGLLSLGCLVASFKGFGMKRQPGTGIMPNHAPGSPGRKCKGIFSVECLSAE